MSLCIRHRHRPRPIVARAIARELYSSVKHAAPDSVEGSLAASYAPDIAAMPQLQRIPLERSIHDGAEDCAQGDGQSSAAKQERRTNTEMNIFFSPQYFPSDLRDA